MKPIRRLGRRSGQAVFCPGSDRDSIGADSLSEVIRRSLAVYDLLYAESAKGGKPFVHYPDGDEKELLLEFFVESDTGRSSR